MLACLLGGVLKEDARDDIKAERGDDDEDGNAVVFSSSLSHK
jgi:hypothetical protein